LLPRENTVDHRAEVIEAVVGPGKGSGWELYDAGKNASTKAVRAIANVPTVMAVARN